MSKIFVSSDPKDFIRAQINEQKKFMVISVGQEDFSIGLDSIGDTLVNHLLPVLKKYKFYQLMFVLKSKYKDSAFSEWTIMSWMMVYSLMTRLDEMFQIKRYKGLGEMRTEDCLETLMDPRTRALTHITSLGDISSNYALLGSKTEARKQLLTGTNMLHNTFYRK